MGLDRFTQITQSGIRPGITLQDINVIGVVTATTLSFSNFGTGFSVPGIVTATSFSGDGSGLTGIAATDNITTEGIVVVGVSTLGNTIVGGATTELIVNGNARITGILTVGTNSITFDGNTDTVRIGSGVTITSGIVSATDYFASNSRKLVALTSGDSTLWFQSVAPVGWTKITTHNDKSLRVVSGNGGGSGGSTAFTSVFASRTPSGSVSGSNSGGAVANTTDTGSVSGSNSGGSVSNTTLSTNEIPSHTHSRSHYSASPPAWGSTATLGTPVSNTSISFSGGGSGNAHGHGFTNPSWSGTITMSAHNHSFTNPTWSGTFSGSAMDFAVQYIDMILCSID